MELVDISSLGLFDIYLSYPFKSGSPYKIML